MLYGSTGICAVVSEDAVMHSWSTSSQGMNHEYTTSDFAICGVHEEVKAHARGLRFDLDAGVDQGVDA